MRQLVIPRYGPPEVLEVREAPDPHVEPGTVRIRVHSAGVNFSDLLARQGLYPDAAHRYIHERRNVGKVVLVP